MVAYIAMDFCTLYILYTVSLKNVMAAKDVKYLLKTIQRLHAANLAEVAAIPNGPPFLQLL